MGKRTRVVPENYELIAKKIRKLEQKLMRKRRRDRHRTPRSRRLSSSSSSDSSSSTSSDSRSHSSLGNSSTGATAEALLPDTLCIEGVPIPSTTATAAAATNTAPLPSTSAGAFTEVPASSIPGIPTYATSTGIDQQILPTEPITALDNELLFILGDDPSQSKSYGDDIQPDYAIRLQHITSSGMSKEVRKELMDKYLPPANCSLIEAPTLNPEVVAAVPETIFKRDKSIEHRQKQRSSAISCVAKALTLLMTSEPRNTALIQILMDAVKLMCDSQNMDSMIRRSFVLNTLKKDLKDQLQATKIDKLLFSESLAEKLKTAKAISKSGADMKLSTTKLPPVKTRAPHKNLNWRGPPQNHRPRGTQSTKEPVYKDRLASSSKPSSRPAQNRGRNRR